MEGDRGERWAFSKTRTAFPYCLLLRVWYNIGAFPLRATCPSRHVWVSPKKREGVSRRRTCPSSGGDLPCTFLLFQGLCAVSTSAVVSLKRFPHWKRLSGMNSRLGTPVPFMPADSVSLHAEPVFTSSRRHHSIPGSYASRVSVGSPPQVRKAMRREKPPRRCVDHGVHPGR